MAAGSLIDVVQQAIDVASHVRVPMLLIPPIGYRTGVWILRPYCVPFSLMIYRLSESRTVAFEWLGNTLAGKYLSAKIAW